jgi:adenylate cyclase
MDAAAADGASGRDDVAWLFGAHALTAAPNDLVRDFCEHLVRRGLPLDRVAVTVGTVHPLVLGRAWIWRRGDAGVERLDYAHDALTAPEYRDSPNRILFEEGGELRRRLVGPDALLDLPFCHEMRAQGMTDYFGLRMPATNPAWLTVATRAADGFLPADVARLRAVAGALGIVVEAHVTREIARTVLETYVGPEAGGRVLGGQITRGDYQHRTAVIWLCDLRGFTALSETLAGGAVVQLLNDYFERMAAAVRAHGGEILKFVGDAMLAIFPTAPRGAAAACRAAVAAARDAVAAMATWNAARVAAGDVALRCGIALHLGDVVYGNIGGVDRLDFTVIGAAVNRAARIEALTASVGHAVLASETVARHADGLRPVGRHRLRDVPAAVELFTLVDA